MEVLTLMAVHAHPDDEVLGTGGVLARYTEEGIRTVLVTCTGGEQGDGPGGVKPGEPGHDEAAVRAQRLAELNDSVAQLGIQHVELLGYRDSGMVGWDANADPDVFCNVGVDAAAARLVELMESYRPQVVLTYDENGGYGHPDHIQAHRVTMAATEVCGIPRKLYYPVVPREGVQELLGELQARGMDISEVDLDQEFGVPEELITATVDVSPYAERKRKALEAHASQSDTIFLQQLPEDLQRRAFGWETFIRRICRVTAPDREDDLFAGLR
jgi:LmbE family N-acetylglucosaminyl deacetylase